MYIYQLLHYSFDYFCDASRTLDWKGCTLPKKTGNEEKREEESYLYVAIVVKRALSAKRIGVRLDIRGKERKGNCEASESAHPVIAPRFHPFPSITKLPQSVAISHKDTALDTEPCTRALPYKDMCILHRE